MKALVCFVRVGSNTPVILLALYVAGNGMHTAPKDNKTALKQLKEQEAMDLFGNQSLNREIRASVRMVETKTNIEQGETTPPHESFQSMLPLEREVTPPLVNVQASSGHVSSPRQYFGFTKLSELGAMVTPQQPHGLHHAGQHPNLDLENSRTFSPAVASPGVTPTVSLPPSLRYNPLPENHPDQPTNLPAAEEAMATCTKRQKVAHNPYQR
jgi:hypothetical protein